MAAKGPFSLKALQHSLANGAFEPVYFFYGSEEHRIQEAVGAIKAAILKNGDPSTAWRVYDLAETPFGELLADVKTVSFFSERRGVLVEGLVKKGGSGGGQKNEAESDGEEKDEKRLRIDEGEQEALFGYLKNPSPDVLLVIATGKVDGRLKFWKDLAALTASAQFESSEGDRRKQVADALQSSGIEFPPDAREWMVERFAPQTALLGSELRKLRLYLGNSTKAALSDIEACMSVPPSESVFLLAESIGARKIDASLEALNSLRSRGEVLFPVFGMVVRQFRVLLLIKSCKEQGLPDAETSRKCGVPIFFLRKYQDQAAKFTAAQLKQSLCLLSQADLKIKSSGLNNWQVFEQEIVRLILGAQSRGRNALPPAT